jgi:hypothetical protein
MSNQSIPSATNGSAGPPVDMTDPAATPTPTITHYQQLKMQFLTGFRELVKIIPNVQIPHPTTKGFVDTHLNVAKPFVDAVIVAVENDPALTAVDKLDTTDGRDAFQYGDAFKEIVTEVLQFGTNLGFTIDSRIAKVNNGALQMYSIAKALARDPNAGVTAVHAGNMKREFKRNAGRARGKKKKAPASPTSPVTPAPTEGKPA